MLALATIPRLLLTYLPTMESAVERLMPKWRGRDHHQPFLSIYQPWTLVVGQAGLPRSFFFSSYLLLLFLFLLIPWRKDADSLYKVAWVWEFQQNYASYHYPKFGSTIKTSRLNRSTWYHLQLGCVACWHLRLTWGRGNRGKWEIGVLLYCHQYCFSSRFDLNTYKDG